MIVVKIGGSLLFNEKEQINNKLISKYAKTIRSMFIEKKQKCMVVVGGGKLARKYISASRAYGASESFNDVVGIEASKLNARLLISALGEIAYPNPPNDFNDFQEVYNSSDKIIVTGGFTPGQSTNAVAAVIAEEVGAKKIINITDVDGVYSDDPKKNPKAELLEKISITDFIEKFASKETTAGYYPLFDTTAIQIIRRSKIPVQFINGTDPENLAKALAGKTIGTEVTF